jgi:hypothetical protein
MEVVSSVVIEEEEAEKGGYFASGGGRGRDGDDNEAGRQICTCARLDRVPLVNDTLKK